MKIKLRENQKRENLIFSVKAITNEFEDEMSDDIFYYMQDLNIAIAQNDHSKLMQAINGLKGALDNNNKLLKLVNKLNDMIE